jgi:phosphoglycolate phosphatase-like HAD superfamily hydrolase
MKGLVFLDFDGVICDSLPETLVSSWRGYYALRAEKEPSAVPITLLEDFRKLRPFVRSGEDFILIHELIAAGISIKSQEVFDAHLAETGAVKIENYKEAFYAARRDFLINHREYWINLNSLYPHASACLSNWASSPFLYILSTKRTKYIVEILTAKGIDIDPARVLSCAAKEKNTTILRILASRGSKKAMFIDDQIDHLTIDSAHGPADPRILGYLAAWGYVQEHWLQDPRGIEVLYPDQLAERLDSWLA